MFMYTHACVHSAELGLSCKDSAARIKRTLTVVPNAALDLYILVDTGSRLHLYSREPISIDYLKC